MQESWVAIIRNIQKLKNPAHFGPWAYRILHHKAMDEFRKQKRDVKEEIINNHDPVEDIRLEQVIAKLNKMDPGDKNILTLYYLEEMPIAEIAFVLDIPPGTVKSRLFHARNKLKKQLNIQ
jgi:RNA polymerase sigma-70 factor (ECF subfamily)